MLSFHIRIHGMANRKAPTEITAVRTRRNKDKEIEVLTARVEYLENRLKAKSAFNSLGERERKAAAIVFSVSVLVFALVFALLAAKSHTISSSSHDDYRRILTEVEDRKWRCSESTMDSLRFLIPSATGKVESRTQGENLVLRFLSQDDFATEVSFSRRDGRIYSFFRGASLELEFSRTVIGSGKTLGIVFGDRKIVLSLEK